MEAKRFCTQCGAQIPAGSQFCPGCGKKVDGTGQPVSAQSAPQAGQTAPSVPIQSVQQVQPNTAGQKQTVAITNNIHLLFGKKSFLIYMLLYYIPIIFSFAIMSEFSTAGFILLIASLVFAVYLLPAKIMCRAAAYDGRYILLNPDAKIASFSDKIAVDDIAHIRIRRVQKPYFDTRFFFKYLQGWLGKYDVIAFDTASQKNVLILVFYTKGNMDQFLPILNQALADHGRDASVIDRNDTLIKIKAFEKE